MFDDFFSILIDINELNNNIFVYKKINNNILSQKYFDTEIAWAGIKDIKIDKKKINVVSFDDLTVNYCKKIKASIIIRGLRVVADFEYEFQLGCNIFATIYIEGKS